MESVITKINKIHDLFKVLNESPIELPQIVVVGTQSAGKSSVLEALVRRSFLPRGSGIVTRCPLILQLHHCPLDDERRKGRNKDRAKVNSQEWAEFLHVPGKTYKIEDVRAEIERRTIELAGPEKNICKDPITIKFFSPDVLDLTLVDLPGLTKLPVGEQPEDIEQQTRTLIRSYIDNPLSLILAVVTGNADIATSDSLQLAKEADPDGSRTLAVVTKLDLMDKGTDAHDVLVGELIPVKLGIIGVVNRSQKDINDNKAIADALEDERKFFEDNYPTLASKMGTPFLSKRLSGLLFDCIKTSLPGVQAKVAADIRDCQRELEDSGEVIEEPLGFTTSIIAKFAETFATKLDATLPNTKEPVLIGGAKINYLFMRLRLTFEAKIPCEEYCLEEAIMAIRNSDGTRPALVVSLYAFEVLMKPLVEKMLQPALDCVKDVMDELQVVCHDSFPREVTGRFPVIKREINQVVKRIVQDCSVKAKEMVRDSIDVELGHVTYVHFENIEQFIDTSGGAAGGENDLPFRSSKEYGTRSPRHVQEFASHLLEMTDKDKKQVRILGRMLEHYYRLTAVKVADGISKIAMTYLINKVKWNLPAQLTIHLLEKDMLGTLFQEDEEIVKRRIAVTQKMKVLENVNGVLTETTKLN